MNRVTEVDTFQRLRVRCPWSVGKFGYKEDDGTLNTCCGAFPWGGGQDRECCIKYCGLLALYGVIREDIVSDETAVKAPARLPSRLRIKR